VFVKIIDVEQKEQKTIKKIGQIVKKILEKNVIGSIIVLKITLVLLIDVFSLKNFLNL
jgi:hypothetical protein